MFTAALITIARTWKQPSCLLTDEWIRKLQYIDKMEYHAATKKCIWGRSNEVDEHRAYYTNDVSEKNKYCILTHIYGI